MTGLMPCLRAYVKSWTAPASEPWSVRLTAGISSSAARATRSGIRQAPSRIEYSEWTWRWTNGASDMPGATISGAQDRTGFGLLASRERSGERGRHRFRRARVEPERRVQRRHQGGGRADADDPAVRAHDDVEDVPRVAVLEEQQQRRDEDEQPDDPAAVAAPPEAAARQQARDRELRYADQPPPDQRQPAPLPLRVVDLDPGRVGRHDLQRERRILIGAERRVAVERDAPAPAKDAEVEPEQSTRIAAGEEHEEEDRDRGQDERDPEEDEDDPVRDQQEPLDEPEPARERLLELPFDPDRVRLHGSSLAHGESWCNP